MALNIEKHKEELLKLTDKNSFAKSKGKLITCAETICHNCDFKGSCEQNKIKWLLEEE